jgi:translation initiation factor IF-1
MSKEECVVMDGVIDEIMPAAMFRIKLDDTDSVVIGYLSGRMRTNNIKVLLGDRVSLEFSPYDLSRGRIIRRL